MTTIQAGRGIAGAVQHSSYERIGPFGFNALLGGLVVFGSIGLIILAAVASSMSLYRLVLFNNRLVSEANPGSHKVLSMPDAGLGMGNGEFWGYLTAAVLIILSVCSGFGAMIVSRRTDRQWSPRERYDRYLVGVGFCLVLLALLNFVALAGFAKVGQLWKILGIGFSEPDAGAEISIHRVLFLILAPGFSVLGALFFHANSLRTKRERLGPPASPGAGHDAESNGDANPATNGGDLAQAKNEREIPAAPGQDSGLPDPPPVIPQAPPVPPIPPALTPSILQPPEGTVLKADASATFIPPGKSVPEKVQVGMQLAEPFNQARFWGGLWFRMGEALVFALVVFLIGAGASAGHLTGATLLLITLLMGMFVKSGESLITGVADKLFAAVKAMVK